MRNELGTMEKALELFFVPTQEQRKVKIKLLIKIENMPIEQKDLTMVQCVSFTGCMKIKEWWQSAEFVSWFLNFDEYREAMEDLFVDSLFALKEIINNSDRKALGPRVTAIKLLLELADKMPKKVQTVEFADKRIGSMSKDELLEYINKQQAQLTPSSVLGLGPKDNYVDVVDENVDKAEVPSE